MSDQIHTGPIIKMLRRPAVRDLSGDSNSAMYQKISQGLWVHPVKLGKRAVGFPHHEVQAILAARVAGKSDDEIRLLVRELEVARKPVARGAA